MRNPCLLLSLPMLISACFSAESYARKDFAKDFNCSGGEVKTKDVWQSTGSMDKLYLEGCGRKITYLCDDNAERCVRPDKLVRARHARQFGCDIDSVDADLLSGNSWRARGCGQEATYVCNNTVKDMSCVMETSEGRARRPRD